MKIFNLSLIIMFVCATCVEVYTNCASPSSEFSVRSKESPAKIIDLNKIADKKPHLLIKAINMLDPLSLGRYYCYCQNWHGHKTGTPVFTTFCDVRGEFVETLDAKEYARVDADIMRRDSMSKSSYVSTALEKYNVGIKSELEESISRKLFDAAKGVGVIRAKYDTVVWFVLE